MSKGDLCWIRNRATGGFCIGRIAGQWEYRSSPEYIEADIVNVRPCAWFHSDVCPKGVPWQQGMTLQHVGNKHLAVTESIEIYNRLSVVMSTLP